MIMTMGFLERQAKALEEKNMRDLTAQKELAERNVSIHAKLFCFKGFKLLFSWFMITGV